MKKGKCIDFPFSGFRVFEAVRNLYGHCLLRDIEINLYILVVIVETWGIIGSVPFMQRDGTKILQQRCGLVGKKDAQ